MFSSFAALKLISYIPAIFTPLLPTTISCFIAGSQIVLPASAASTGFVHSDASFIEFFSCVMNLRSNELLSLISL